MNRYLPLLVFAGTALIGLGMATAVYRSAETERMARFEAVADDAADRVDRRVDQHIALLAATRALLAANDGEVSKPVFSKFVAGLNLGDDFSGVRGLGFARLIRTGNEAPVKRDLSEDYGLERSVWPETDQALRVPIVLLEPDDTRNRAALGYDMFNEATRRDAIMAAIETGKVRASAPVQLVQEITEEKQAGFLVYLPLVVAGADIMPASVATDRIAGFVYAPFRAGDLHVAALSRPPRLPVVVETHDTTGDTRIFLFRSAGFDLAASTGSLKVERVFEVAGRQWTMTVSEVPGARSFATYLATFALGALSLLLAAALAASTRYQLRALSAARELQAISEKAARDNSLMLHEMKHRIKNSIARVLAIARQTAATSDTVDEFSASFNARLQAMARVQDLLTGTDSQRADLRALVLGELEQVFGDALDQDQVEGPGIELNERAVQALGLTFHELATNALKYGGLSEEKGGLNVRWRVERTAEAETLVLDWTESAGAPIAKSKRKGFGTKLIDASIRGELGGKIERGVTPAGMAVTMRIPVEALTSADGEAKEP